MLADEQMYGVDKWDHIQKRFSLYVSTNRVDVTAGRTAVLLLFASLSALAPYLIQNL